MNKKTITILILFLLLSLISFLITLNSQLKLEFKLILTISPIIAGIVSIFILSEKKESISIQQIEVNKEPNKKSETKEISPTISEDTLPKNNLDEIQKAVLVQILALLQKEGRFIDFLHEDIEKYDDAMVGAAVRSLHKSCKALLNETFGVKPIINELEGTEVEIDADYDPLAIKLIGKVKGKPPYKGILIHSGWMLTDVKLAKIVNQKSNVIYPAEIEVK